MCVLLATVVRLNQLYALSGMPQRTKRQSPTQDQLIYSPLEDIFTIWQCSPDKFRVSYANTDFKLCASYPEAAIVPKAISDEDLKKVRQSKICNYSLLIFNVLWLKFDAGSKCHILA